MIWAGVIVGISLVDWHLIGVYGSKGGMQRSIRKRIDWECMIPPEFVEV